MNPLNRISYWLYLVFALVIFYTFFYDYDISSLKYREGIVSEAKITDERVTFHRGSRPSGDYGNLKFKNDTIVYCYTWQYANQKIFPSFISYIIDTEYLIQHGIKEGDKVGIWFNPHERNSCEVFMKNRGHDIPYERYRYRLLPKKDAYAINIHGLTINDKVIIKPQFYNYVRPGNYFIMAFAQFIIAIVCIAIHIELFFYIVHKVRLLLINSY